MANPNIGKHRTSPKGGTRFPRDDLDSVLKYVKKLCGKTHTNKINLSDLNVGVFGVGAGSISGKIKLSSMKQYGLLDGSYKELEATELSRNINMSTGPEQKKLLQQAFMNVDVFKKTFNTFQSSTENKSKIIQYAVNPLKVHPDNASDFAANFVKSAKIAGLCTESGENITFISAKGLSEESIEDSTKETNIDELHPEEHEEENEEDFNGEKKSQTHNSIKPVVELKVDSSSDPDKLEKQLKLLKKYGLI